MRLYGTHSKTTPNEEKMIFYLLCLAAVASGKQWL